VSDAASQDASQWNEVARKEIKSKWIRSYTIQQPTNITGVVIYHCNPENGAGTGGLGYDPGTGTMAWQAPGDSIGPSVSIDKDGTFQLFSGTASKYIRVVVTYNSLPASQKSDNLTISAIPGSAFATTLATHWVARYRDPQAELTFDLDIAGAIHLDKFIKVSDIIKVSSDRIVTKGRPKWNQEPIFITATRPDFDKRKFQVSGIQTTFKKRYGFIGPSTLTSDYDSATTAQKEYAFVGDSNNQVGAAKDDGYYIW